MSTDPIRPPLVLLAVMALGGCGTISPQPATSGGSGSALGQRIATGPSVATASTATTTATAGRRPAAPAPGPDSIRLPSPPAASAPRSRAILRVATRFARAYLRYQIGRDSHPVRAAILATSTPSFGRLLVSQPVSIPASQRHRADAQPSELSTVRYTGAASLGPGPPVPVVIARYHTLAHPTVGGQLTIELTRRGGRWLVSSLR